MSSSKAVTFAAAAALALALAAGTAEAKSGVNVGALNCTVEGGVGLILGSKKDMTCVYKSNKGKRATYTGSVTKIGIDIGVTTQSYITWAVFAPGDIDRGALEGSYGGASAEATIGVGLGANVLVGGLEDSIALQPISVQGQEGLNVAAGVTGMKLRYDGD
jgi:hypothetical protein